MNNNYNSLVCFSKQLSRDQYNIKYNLK